MALIVHCQPPTAVLCQDEYTGAPEAISKYEQADREDEFPCQGIPVGAWSDVLGSGQRVGCQAKPPGSMRITQSLLHATLVLTTWHILVKVL